MDASSGEGGTVSFPAAAADEAYDVWDTPASEAASSNISRGSWVWLELACPAFMWLGIEEATV